MTEPQTWVMIGVFTTIMIGGMTLMTTLTNRTLRSAIDGVNGRIDGVTGRIDGVTGQIEGLRGELHGELVGVNARIDGLRGEMNARFESLDVRIDHLDSDSDIAAVAKRVFGDRRPES